MADNVPITAGSGTDVATDDVGGIHFQRVKLVDGTADSSTAIPGDATNGLDVDITRIAAGDNNIGNVDIVSVPAPLSTAGGGTEATALRVTLATDSTGVVSVDDNSSSLTVDAPIGTPVNVQIGNASLTAGVIDETGASAVDALAVGGGTAHDAVDSGNPIKIGGKAIADVAGATMVAAADRANLNVGLDGTLLTRPYTSISNSLVERLTNTDGASTASTVFGATANAKNCITTIAVYNASTTTSGYIDFRDGTAGTVLFTLPLPAGGGAVVNFPVPLVQTTSNTAFAYDVSTAITTVYISLIGFKSKA